MNCPATKPRRRLTIPKNLQGGEDRELKRRGDVEKCPVCGSHVDAEAYHCPSCRNYFCFHCRSRLVPPDTQLQCVNQQCDYYGKLICDVCDREHERDEEPTVYAEPEDGYWPGWLLLALITFGCVWYFSSLVVARIVGGRGFLAWWRTASHCGREYFWQRKNRRASAQEHLPSLHLCCGEIVKEIQRVK